MLSLLLLLLLIGVDTLELISPYCLLLLITVTLEKEILLELLVLKACPCSYSTAGIPSMNLLTCGLLLVGIQSSLIIRP